MGGDLPRVRRFPIRDSTRVRSNLKISERSNGLEDLDQAHPRAFGGASGAGPLGTDGLKAQDAQNFDGLARLLRLMLHLAALILRLRQTVHDAVVGVYHKLFSAIAETAQPSSLGELEICGFHASCHALVRFLRNHCAGPEAVNLEEIGGVGGAAAW